MWFLSKERYRGSKSQGLSEVSMTWNDYLLGFQYLYGNVTIFLRILGEKKIVMDSESS